MADDSAAPATKQDIGMIMEEIGKLYSETKRWKDEIIHEFHVVAEDIRHDAMGAQKDKISVLSDRSENHEKRITRLEKHTGMIAA